MKRRILTVTLGLILISSLAYAAKKKEQAKALARPADTTSEEKALKAELLDATEGQKKTQLNADETDSKKVIPIFTSKTIQHQITAKQP